MSVFPPEPDVGPDQRAEGDLALRYDDVTQNGTLTLDALLPAIGVIWRERLSTTEMASTARAAGVVPVMTRLVLESGAGPVAVQSPIHAHCTYQLMHTADEEGQVDRIVLGLWARLVGSAGRTHGPPPDNAGERLQVGRLFGEHVFTRPFAPPEQRRVTRLDFSGTEPIPPARYRWTSRRDILELPGDAEPVDDKLLPEPVPTPFGIDHTDSNQHVTSLTYPRLFRTAALRRLSTLGMRTDLQVVHTEIGYRKPHFAGDRVRIHLRAFTLPAQQGRRGAGAVGLFMDDNDSADGSDPDLRRASCYVRMLLRE